MGVRFTDKLCFRQEIASLIMEFGTSHDPLIRPAISWGKEGIGVVGPLRCPGFHSHQMSNDQNTYVTFHKILVGS